MKLARKKILPALLTFFLVLTLIPAAFVAASTSFPNVDSGSNYAVAMEYVSKTGVMVGDDQVNFNPNKIALSVTHHNL